MRSGPAVDRRPRPGTIAGSQQPPIHFPPSREGSSPAWAGTPRRSGAKRRAWSALSRCSEVQAEKRTRPNGDHHQTAATRIQSAAMQVCDPQGSRCPHIRIQPRARSSARAIPGARPAPPARLTQSSCIPLDRPQLTSLSCQLSSAALPSWLQVAASRTSPLTFRSSDAAAVGCAPPAA